MKRFRAIRFAIWKQKYTYFNISWFCYFYFFHAWIEFFYTLVHDLLMGWAVMCTFHNMTNGLLTIYFVVSNKVQKEKMWVKIKWVKINIFMLYYFMWILKILWDHIDWLLRRSKSLWILNIKCILPHFKICFGMKYLHSPYIHKNMS